MGSMQHKIAYLTSEMKAAGFTFNGMQIWDHGRVLEVCSVEPMMCFARAVGEPETGWHHDNTDVFRDMVSLVVKKFISFRDHGVNECDGVDICASYRELVPSQQKALR